LLQERCIECHGEKKQKGELRLDAKSLAFKGGHDGPAIVAGKSTSRRSSSASPARDENERMPPKGDPLTPSQIKTIQTWIESGAIGLRTPQTKPRWRTNVSSTGPGSL
jgi:mono/diheme cytochrome c family protein